LLGTKSIRREIAGEHALGAEYRVQIGSGSAQLGASFAKERSALPRMTAKLADAVTVDLLQDFAGVFFAGRLTLGGGVASTSARMVLICSLKSPYGRTTRCL
jgi:hypothetical protein